MSPPTTTLDPPCGPYHHVALNLLVHAGQPVLPAVLGQAGLQPPLGPCPIILFIQILVGQNQGPQPFPCILLGTEPRRSPSPPAPMTLRSEPQGLSHHTYIQVVSGGAKQLRGGRVESVQQESVSPFAVESDPPFWIAHYDRGMGKRPRKTQAGKDPPNLTRTKATQPLTHPGLYAPPNTPRSQAWPHR